MITFPSIAIGFISAALGLAIPVLAAGPVNAQTSEEQPSENRSSDEGSAEGLHEAEDLHENVDRRGNWSLTIENDIIANTDREYTNGAHLSWLSAPGDVPAWIREFSSAVPTFAPEGRLRWGLVFGQSIFTPENLMRRELIRDDRPYAGWLYAGLAMHSETPTRLDTLEIDVGVIGPYSFAEETQKAVHRWIDSTRPRGWNNQLETEPGIALIYERQWRQRLLQLSERENGLGVDMTPLIGGAIGNVYTYATTGLSLRFGNNLPSDFGPPRIRPGLPGSAFFDLERNYGWYLFASAEGRAVARNIFLDGNTFRDSHSVDKHPFVADFQVGFTFTIDSARLAVAQVFRSSEYEGDDTFDSFATISLSLKF